MMTSSWLYLLMLTTNVPLIIASSVTSLLGSSFGTDVVGQNKQWGFGMGDELLVAGNSSSSSSSSSTEGRLRIKRQLVNFPEDAVLDFNFKLVVPYWSFPKVSTKGDYRLEITYELPNSLLRRRRKRSLENDRSTLYGLVQDFFSKAGLDGASCVLRAVCEVGAEPLDEYGVMGEFINLIFAPGFRASEVHQDHIQAEEYGRSYGNCWSAYPDCPVSMRELLHDFFLGNANISLEDTS